MKGRTMKKTTAAIAAAAAILLTGCATGTPEPEPTTVTETTTEPAPEPSTVTETAEPEPEPTDGSALVDSALEVTWTGTSEADKTSICEGMDLAPDMMIDVFMEEFYATGEMDGVEIDRQQVQDFFMGKCGL